MMQGCLDETIDPRSSESILRETASTDKQLHWMERSIHCVILDQEWEQASELALRFVERLSK